MNTGQTLAEVEPPIVFARAAGRRRYLTILFSDLSNSTQIAAAMEAEDYADLLENLRRIYEEIIPRHGGSIVRIDGDGVTVIFGHPETNEDDGRRATEAALDLHDAVRMLATRSLPWARGLKLHTGIHSGLVLFNAGDLVRGRFEMIGDATNVASRLASVAEADEIVVSEATLGAERHFFRTGTRRSLWLKGKSKPVPAFTILGREPVKTRFAARARRGLAPFVGRTAELAALDRCLQEAIGGPLRIAKLAGTAGLGKTRLAREFLERAAIAGCQVHRGYCESYLGAEPLQPFLQLLRSIFQLDHTVLPDRATAILVAALDAIDPGLEPHKPALLHLLSLTGPDDDGRAIGAEASVAALCDLFDRLAAANPLVLFVDDWQWADDASRQVLSAYRSGERRNVLILLASREADASEGTVSLCEELALDPFTSSEAAATVAALLPTADPFTVARIHDYSGGNPLFLEELCHSLSSGEHDQRPQGGSAWLDVLIESRFARLSEDQAELVRVAAVIGNVVPVWLVEQITGCSEDHPLVEALANQDFIYHGDQPGTLRFKHGLTRDVIYQAVGLHVRKQLHLQVAEALRQQSALGGDDLFEGLAYHYGAGGDPLAAARYAELAGDKASAASALDRAQSQFRAALDALDALDPSEEIAERWDQIFRRFVRVSLFDPSHDQIPVFQQALERARMRGDRAASIRAEYWLGCIYYPLGEAQLTIEHCEIALAGAHELGDERLVGEIRTTLGQAAAAACDYDRAIALLDEAIVAKRARADHRPSVQLSYSLLCRGFIVADRGSFDEAQACYDEAIGAVHGVMPEVEASLVAQRSAVCLWQGRWQEAADFADAAERISEQVRTRYTYSMSRALGASARWAMDRSPEAIRTLLEATSWLEASDRNLFISINYGWLAKALVASGRIDEARRHAARALSRARKRDRLGEAMAYRALARAAASTGDRTASDRYLAMAMRVAHARQSPHEVATTRLCAAEIALSYGDRPDDLLDQAEAAFAAMGMEHHLREVARLRALSR